MKQRYRVTPRGKVVFSLVGICLFTMICIIVLSALQNGMEMSSHDDTLNKENINLETTSMNRSEDTLEDSESTVSDFSDSEYDQVEKNQELETTERSLDTDSEEEDALDQNILKDNLEILYNAFTTIYFDPDKYLIQDSSKLELNVFADIAKDYPDLLIVVEGNINGYPKFDDTKFGKELSQIRASKVEQYLINLGIDASRFIVISNGSSKPLNKSDQEEELMLNRRVDIYFKEYFIQAESNKK